MLKSKEEVMNAIKKSDWQLLENTAKYFKDDYDLVMFALENNDGFILQYANDTIRNDMEIALKALSSGYMKFIGETIRHNPSFMIETIKRSNPYKALCSPLVNKICKKVNQNSFRAHYYSALYSNIDIEGLYNRLLEFHSDFLHLYFGYIIEKTPMDGRQVLFDTIDIIREEVFLQYGVNFPKISIYLNPILPHNAYQFMIQEKHVAEGVIDFLNVNSVHMMSIILKESIIKNIPIIKQYQDVPAIMSKD